MALPGIEILTFGLLFEGVNKARNLLIYTDEEDEILCKPYSSRIDNS
jgi:hypothetical protein